MWIVLHPTSSYHWFQSETTQHTRQVSQETAVPDHLPLPTPSPCGTSRKLTGCHTSSRMKEHLWTNACGILLYGIALPGRCLTQPSALQIRTIILIPVQMPNSRWISLKRVLTQTKICSRTQSRISMILVEQIMRPGSIWPSISLIR